MLKPANKEELKKIIKNRILTEGFRCDLNDIDVSDITDMSYLFYGSSFNGDISNWNVSKVTNMSHMFEGDCWGEEFDKTFLVHAGSLGDPPLAHGGVEALRRFVVVELLFAVIREKVIQADRFHAPFLELRRGNVAGGIGNQYVVLSHCACPFRSGAGESGVDKEIIYHAGPVLSIFPPT